MILVETRAVMKCETPTCEATIQVELALKGDGTFAANIIGAQKATHGWQFGCVGDMGGIFLTYCPLHHQSRPRIERPNGANGPRLLERPK